MLHHTPQLPRSFGSPSTCTLRTQSVRTAVRRRRARAGHSRVLYLARGSSATRLPAVAPNMCCTDAGDPEWEAVEEVYPFGLMQKLFVIDAVYCGVWVLVILGLLVGEWGFEQGGVGAALWLILFFGLPWWGPATCALSGSGLTMCRCCSPTTALKVGMTLCLIGGIIPVCVTVLGFITTGGFIAEETVEDDTSTMWQIFYVFWVPGSLIIGLLRIVLPSVACGQGNAPVAAKCREVRYPQQPVAVVVVANAVGLD